MSKRVKFDLSNNNLSAVDIEHPFLTEVWIENNPLQHLNLKSPEISVLRVEVKQLTLIDMKKLASLQRVEVAKESL
mgnify:CR=1 FL=1